MFNLPAISKLLQDNPDLLTTEGLSALLHDCICLKYAQHHRFTYPSLLVDNSIYLELAQMGTSKVEDEALIRRVMASSKIWTADGCESQEEAADFLVLFRKIRDNIHQLQQDLGISGVSQRHISIRDHLFSYPAPEDQLILLEYDRRVLKNAVPGVIKYFLELVQMSPTYNLFFVDENENKIPTTVAIVEDAAARAVKAEIYSESYNWKPTNTNCWEGKPAPQLHPDEIHLILHLDWDENKFMFFDAHYPDISRWPWLTNN
ncbi:hypothetical protein NIES21_60970 (plasmid) [Anabaenopsis circularis NIES-21]|uniref:Uncharacterized protein n=1 Tax=Anabaenopsis circularis NIES-21 TaxID=1085406 RepID=A0A1Z4GRW8_9CYAN|nr:hypothetical protein NIES21_60970 [Anabaenopsis circularis NIES-21]